MQAAIPYPFVLLVLSGCFDQPAVRSAVVARMDAKIAAAARDATEQATCRASPALAEVCLGSLTPERTRAALDAGLPAWCRCPAHEQSLGYTLPYQGRTEVVSLEYSAQPLLVCARNAGDEESERLLLAAGARLSLDEVEQALSANDWTTVEEQVRRGVDLTDLDLARHEFRRDAPFTQEQRALLEGAGAYSRSH